MSEILIQYEDRFGESREWIASVDVRRIDMRSKNIASIDLTELEECSDLERLDLSWNEIKQVDLTPLSGCSKLRALDLKQNDLKHIDLVPLRNCRDLRILDISENCLRSIDLQPLSGCTNLQKLVLEENDFGMIDLQPLRQCTKLEVLDLENTGLRNIDLNMLENCPNLRRVTLHGNNLKEVDLSSLSTCSNLQVVDLLRNSLQNVDVTPLLACENLNVLFMTRGAGEVLLDEKAVRNIWPEIKPGLFSIGQYDVPVLVDSLDLLRKLAAIVEENEPNSWKHLHLMHSLSKILNLQDLGFLDVTAEQLLSIAQESNIEAMRDRLIDARCRQIEGAGTTIGLHVEKIVHLGIPQIVVKLPRILELRRKEMERVTVDIDTRIDKVDLRWLHLTAYGHKILSTLGLGLECNSQQFRQVADYFRQAGFTIKTSKRRGTKAVNQPLHETMNMSRNMQDYVWVLALPSKRAVSGYQSIPTR